jgi:hypothetical protein
MSAQVCSDIKGLPLFLTVGFVGKRNLQLDGRKDSHGEGFAHIKDLLTQVWKNLGGRCESESVTLVGLSSLAMGADVAFAQVVAESGSMQRVFLPEPRDRFFGD